MSYDQGDLRYVRLGDREIIRRIFAAVRDRDWNTVPGVLKNVQLEDHGDSFHVSYDVEHRDDEIHFAWHGELTGSAAGTIRFDFDGEALSTFQRMRIGCCVLHPLREHCGTSCRVERTDGTIEAAAFPVDVTPVQPLPGFHDLRSIEFDAGAGARVNVRFLGDVFETEDQRNWLDASFKTYSTPLGLPCPVTIAAGARVSQSVTVRLCCPDAEGSMSTDPLRPFETGIRRPRSPVPAQDDAPVLIDVDFDATRALCDVGVSVPEADALSPAAWERLERLQLSHLRVDVRLGDGASLKAKNPLSRLAEATPLPLELALHFPAGVRDFDVSWLRQWCRPSRIGRLLVFQDGQACTSRHALESARSLSADFGIPLAVGTTADLFELLQGPLPTDGAEFLCWSMNPQVHASDDASIAESPEGAAHQVQSARRRFPGMKVAISPVTLRPRINTDDDPQFTARSSPELSPPVDPRQFSMFGAAWTLGMLKELTAAGAQSATFFDVVGPGGIMASESRLPGADRIPATGGAVYPIYHLLANMAGFKTSLATRSSDSLRVEALSLGDARGRFRMLVANWTQQERLVSLPPSLAFARVRTLEASSLPCGPMSREDVLQRTCSGLPDLLRTRATLTAAPCSVTVLDLER